MRPGPNSYQTCGPSNWFRLARIAATSSALTPWKDHPDSEGTNQIQRVVMARELLTG
jgi:hypothetical protein